MASFVHLIREMIGTTGLLLKKAKQSKAKQQPNKTLKLKTENDKDREKKTTLLFSKVTFSPKTIISD